MPTVTQKFAVSSPVELLVSPLLVSQQGAKLSDTPVPVAIRFLPSLTDIAFLMPVIFLFGKLGGARQLLGDGDTGWHIRTGEWILANGNVPHSDMFSFTRPGAPWFAWEWLSDVGFAMLHGLGGLGAVVLASLVVICLTSAMLFRLVRRKCDNGFIAIAVTLLATGGCAVHWLARPHLFTLLFLVLTLHVTERARESQVGLLAWLVPLAALWVNLHGGFFVIFLVLATYLGQFAILAAVEPDSQSRKRHLRAMMPWLATVAGCFAATFLNPYGWTLYKHLAEYLQDSYSFQYISEFQGMNFHSPVALYFEPLMIGGILTCFLNFRRRRFQEVLLVLGWLQLSLVAQRNIPLFAIVTAPILGEGIVTMLRATSDARLARWMKLAPARFLSFVQPLDLTDRLGRVHLVSALTIAGIAFLLLLPRPVAQAFAASYDPAIYPEQALQTLLSPQTHRIFSDDEWGDFLVYKLYPSRQVFIDGRSDFYGHKFCMEYQKLMNVEFDFQTVLDRYSIDTIVLSPRLTLATALKLSTDWKVIYDDHVAVIFRRSQAEPLSTVPSAGGNSRGREITRSFNRDLRITPTNTKN